MISLNTSINVGTNYDNRRLVGGSRSVASFNGKVAASNVENPHSLFHLHSTFVVDAPPSDYTLAEHMLGYSGVSTLDGTLTMSGSMPGTGKRPMHFFKVNVIAQIEINIGKIPFDSLALKVEWARKNISNLNFLWYGRGYMGSVNNAYFSLSALNRFWYVKQNSTDQIKSSSISLVESSPISSFIYDDGCAYAIAYTDPSPDGTQDSRIYTDYFNCLIIIKEGSYLL